MTETAVSAGGRLKGAREQRGLSVQKAASELHLEPWMVEALEAGQFDRVGPPVYSKGYLRRYSTLLGVPADEILAGFGVIAAPAAVAAPSPEQAETPRSPMSTPQLFGALVVVLLVAALFYWKPWANPGRTAPPAVQTEVSAERAPAIVPDEPVVASTPPPAPAHGPVVTGSRPTSLVTAPTTRPASPVGAAGTAAAVEPSTEPGAGRARLRLSFTADSWVEVRDALGNKSFFGNGSANTVRTIAGQAPMHVFLRQGSGVQLEINGHTVAIGPQFFAGDVARFQAGADGVLRREPPREASASNSRPPG